VPKGKSIKHYKKVTRGGGVIWIGLDGQSLSEIWNI
jgi:hypothetical protein